MGNIYEYAKGKKTTAVSYRFCIARGLGNNPDTQWSFTLYQTRNAARVYRLFRQ